MITAVRALHGVRVASAEAMTRSRLVVIVRVSFME
jgi:hypothetical protein